MDPQFGHDTPLLFTYITNLHQSGPPSEIAGFPTACFRSSDERRLLPNPLSLTGHAGSPRRRTNYQKFEAAATTTAIDPISTGRVIPSKSPGAVQTTLPRASNWLVKLENAPFGYYHPTTLR